MKKIILLISTLMFTAPALAESIHPDTFGKSVLTCARDSRAADGPMVTVRLLQNRGGLYNANYEVVPSGFGSPNTEPSIERIATNMKCTFSKSDARIVNCSRYRDQSEKANTGFSTNKKITTGVNIGDGEDYTYTSLKLTAYSPELIEGSNDGRFPEITDHNGRALMEFRLDNCISFRK